MNVCVRRVGRETFCVHETHSCHTTKSCKLLSYEHVDKFKFTVSARVLCGVFRSRFVDILIIALLKLRSRSNFSLDAAFLHVAASLSSLAFSCFWFVVRFLGVDSLTFF